MRSLWSCLKGVLQKWSLLEVSNVAQFCVAGVPFCDIATKPFCVTGAVLVRGFQKMTCIFRGRCSTLETSIHRHFARQGQHFRRVVLRVFCESYCQGCFKWTPHKTRLFALHTLHSTLYICRLHFTLYTLHSTLYT